MQDKYGSNETGIPDKHGLEQEQTHMQDKYGS